MTGPCGWDTVLAEPFRQLGALGSLWPVVPGNTPSIVFEGFEPPTSYFLKVLPDDTLKLTVINIGGSSAHCREHFYKLAPTVCGLEHQGAWCAFGLGGRAASLWRCNEWLTFDFSSKMADLERTTSLVDPDYRIPDEDLLQAALAYIAVRFNGLKHVTLILDETLTLRSLNATIDISGSLLADRFGLRSTLVVVLDIDGLGLNGMQPLRLDSEISDPVQALRSVRYVLQKLSSEEIAELDRLAEALD